MKTAVIVHNQIISDARVRKECRSLEKSGFDITIFGYGSDENEITNIENCKTYIIKRVSFKFNNKLEKRVKRIFNFFPKIEGFQIKLLFKKIFFNKLFLIFSSFLLILIKKRYKVRKIYRKIPFSVFFIKLIYRLFKLRKKLFTTSKQLTKFFKRKYYSLKRKSLRFFIGTYLTYPFISNLIFNKLKKYKFDVIHAHDIIALLVAIKYKKHHPNVLIIWDAHEIYTHLSYKTFLDKIYIRNLISKSSKSIDRFITINHSIGDFYLKNFPGLAKPLILMNATNHNENIINKSFLIQKETDLKKSQKILLFQGGLSINRGIEELLEAAKYLNNDWSIVFMGSGKLEDLIIDTKNNLNIERPNGENVISLIPPAPYQDLALWTSCADLGAIFYKNTSLNQFFCTPNKIWEYPNANVPIICSNLFEMSKIVSSNKIGFVINENSTGKEIAHFVNHLSDEILLEIKENCNQFSRNQSWQVYEKKLISMYKFIENSYKK